MQRLFFLNGEQDLLAFLLVDLGIVKYPTYKCIISQQIFSGRDGLLAYEEVLLCMYAKTLKTFITITISHGLFLQAIEVAQIIDEALDGSNIELVIKCIDIADSRISSESTQSLTSESMAPFLSRFSAKYVYSKVVLLGISFLEREHRYDLGITCHYLRQCFCWANYMLFSVWDF